MPCVQVYINTNKTRHLVEQLQEGILVSLRHVVREVATRHAVTHRVDVGLEVVFALLEFADLAVLHHHFVFLVLEGVDGGGR